ncbi:putative inactive phospholipase D5-like [Triplophysa rosa]|uniref:Inactive phospholipase D5-like n=1 Tax=Triplophysa rosa TaxID=992332 RepID=A0A9W7WNB2_TRIRA|nr:putative inactive phospholipase D5-like [Triplophysa rosa]
MEHEPHLELLLYDCEPTAPPVPRGVFYLWANRSGQRVGTCEFHELASESAAASPEVILQLAAASTEPVFESYGAPPEPAFVSAAAPPEWATSPEQAFLPDAASPGQVGLSRSSGQLQPPQSWNPCQSLFLQSQCPSRLKYPQASIHAAAASPELISQSAATSSKPAFKSAAVSPKPASKSVAALSESVLQLAAASPEAGGSPDVFCPKERMKDIEAIFRVIQEAKTFIYISVPNYLPILKRTQPKYWSQIDNMLREALILKKNMKVCMLVSCWEQTDHLTFNFLWSLKSLCMDSINCSLEAKFFIQREQRGGRLYGINRNRYMVTDNSVYLGNFDWVANEFVFNAGVGIVINQQNKMNSTVVEIMKAVFERDWNSQYSKTLQANKIPACSKHTIKEHTDNMSTPALLQNSKA